MKHRLFMVLLLAVASLVQAQSNYTDAERSYKLHVPPGWQIETQPGGVSLIKGQAYASVWKVSGRGAPKGLVEALSRKIASQWKHFEGASSGNSQLGGKPGAYAWYTGVDPRGVDAVLKVVAVVDGEFGYALFVSAPRSNFDTFKGDFDKIEAGFELTGAGNRN
jgi:hypothetical protein